MGYTTKFRGRFDLGVSLTVDQVNTLMKISNEDDSVDMSGAPDSYCQWAPSKDGRGIEWDGGEKFYDYVAWLQFVIDRFLKPWGHFLNGRVAWQGEEPEDQGVIHVRNNQVQAIKNVITKPDPAWKIEQPEPKWGGE